ncbi:MAG TPA: VCBS domain-containing protein, partial [Hypericibacter adhaerens]|uniref:VCBS domain-containing protein n=1 Tax=Hypericibacter adhaerens TaxID=2602016 RepID=UPI002B6FA6E4
MGKLLRSAVNLLEAITGQKAGGKPAIRSGSAGDAAPKDLKKAIDRPISGDGPARDEAPIGWDFGVGEVTPIGPVAEATGKGAVPGEAAPAATPPDTEIVVADAKTPSTQLGEARGAGAGDSGSPEGLPRASGGGSHGVFDGPRESVVDEFLTPPRPSPADVPPFHVPEGGGGSGGTDHGDTDDGNDHGGEEGQPSVPSPPTVGGVDQGSVTEDSVLSASGTLVASSPSGGDIAWSMVGPGEGRYGTLDFDPATGQWTYSLDNEAAQGLREGESAQEIFTLRVVDQAGVAVDHRVTVTVTGTNDAPVISGTASGAVTEDEASAASGQLTATDIDIGASASWSLVGGGSGSYGTLTLDDTGHWSYALDNDAAQSLRADSTAQDIFTVRVTDDAGATVTQTVTVTIAGTNDAPVISGAGTGLVREDDTLVTSGSLTVSDVDADDTATWSVVGPDAGRYGSFALDAEGNWSYALNNDAAQRLRADETVQEIFTVRATDQSGAFVEQQVTVTVAGTNDAPVIISNSAGYSVTEDSDLTVTGSAGWYDPDVGDTTAWSLPGGGQGSYGSLTLDPATGSWTYILDNDAAQGLKEGETRDEIFVVRLTDGSGSSTDASLAVTVKGTNDRPVISGVHTGAVSEDGVQTASGRLEAHDADIGDTAGWSVAPDSASHLGALTVDASG